MRILADVNISPRVVAWLRAQGVDAARVGVDVLDARATDEEVLAEARRRDAIVLSRDQDFSALLATTGARSPSLVNLRLSSVVPEIIGQAVLVALETAADDLAAGAVVTIADGGARVLRLPIE